MIVGIQGKKKKKKHRRITLTGDTTHTHTHTHTPPSVYINTQQRRITGDTHKAVERLLTRTHTHTHTHTEQFYAECQCVTSAP